MDGQTDQTTQTTATHPQDQTSRVQSQGQSAFAVPEAYKDRPWVEKVKSSDDLWKTLDNAQSLIGKRPAGIPGPDATPEEMAKFYAAWGRPESPDKYEFKDVEGLPKETDISPWKQKAAKFFHDVGLNQKQADQLWQMYLKDQVAMFGEMQGKSKEQQAALDAEFDKVSKEHFGDGFDAASKRTQETVARLVPEALRSAYADLADKPKALAAVVSLVEGMNKEMEALRKEYGAEGKLPGGDGGGTPGKSLEDMRKELASLRTSPEARDFTNAKNKETIAKINDLSAQVQAALKRA